MNLERFGHALGVWISRRPWFAVVFGLATCLAVSVGLRDITVSSDYRVFFSDDDPEKLAFDELESVFTKTDNVVFVVKPASGAVFEPATLGALQGLTERAWKLPHATRVDSVTNFQHSYAEDEDIIIEDLVFGPAETLSEQELAEIRSVALAEPLLAGGLLATDGAAAGVNVTLRLPRESPVEVTQTAQAARQLAAEFEGEHPGLEIRVSGMALMNDAFMEASIEDMKMIVPAMYVVMIVVLALLLRSVVATGIVVLIVAMSSAVTMGVSGWLGYPLTPPTASAPTVVLTLAVADGVHLFLSARGELQNGASRAEAVAQALRVNFRPVLLTSLTTIVGFACLNFAEAPPYWHLANMTVAGITAAFVYSVTVLPALLMLLPLRVPPARPASSSLMERIADLVLRHRTRLVVGGAVTAVCLGVAASRLESNDQFLRYFDDSITFRPDTEFMMENLTGIYTVEYAVQAGGESAINEPEYLEGLDAFTQWLRLQPEVTHVYSYADIIKRINQNLHEGKADQYVVPPTREAASQELMLYEMSLPVGLDLNDRIDVARSSTRVSVTLRDLSSRELLRFKGRSEMWLQANTPPAMHAHATSPVIIFTTLSQENTKSMMAGNLASLLLISACLMVALGSWRLGLLSIVPNLLPILFGYGLWSLLFSEINIVASIAGTVCLGIIVDDTIHFLTKYRLARTADGKAPSEAIRSTLVSVGPALISTTLVLFFGFGVLTQSGFQMNSDLGLLVVLVVGFALLHDLLLLPALLSFAERDPKTEKDNPV